jgi:ADP-ribose pyrophosphatase YjhB (NUDIX family)
MFTIGAFAIILDAQGRVLLSHRRDMDLWNLPGGAVERGELPTEAVVREVVEETGLEVAIDRLVGVYGKEGRDEIVFAFACRVTGGRLTLTDEADAHAYFERDRIPRNTPPKQVERIEDALCSHSQPFFKRQTAPSTREYLQELRDSGLLSA